MARILKLIFVFIALTFFNFLIFAERNTEVKNLRFLKNFGKAKVSIDLKENLREKPILEIRNNILQLTLPDAFVWPKIEKTVSLDKKLDTKVLAYQFDKKNVRFRIIFPYSLKDKKSSVKIAVLDKKIDVIFPNEKIEKEKVSDFDETYLNKLLEDKNSIDQDNKKNDELALDQYFNKKNADKPSDEVTSIASSNKKNNVIPFSFWPYVAKASIFLTLVLILFYGIVHLIRKGVLKKGKLNLFNSDKIIEILTTSYLGSKRSLMLVRVHKQIFLISSTEKGMNLLSEIKDVSGLLKEGELQVSGTNFDKNLKEAKSKEFNLKEVLTSSNQNSLEKKDFSNSKKEEVIKDEVKLSDQIKSKIKSLRPLQ